MTTATVWPLEITPLGDEACATVAYRHRGVPWVAAVVKATFAFVPEGAMLRVPTEPIAVADEHYEHDPRQSVRIASDLTPYRPHADVLLRGFACTHRGRPAPWLMVRLQVLRGGAPVLNKEVVVHGAPDPARPGERIPFMRAPLRWELAAGGPPSVDNPAGSAEARIFDPQQWDRPAGFGAVAREWPARQRLLGALDPARLHAPWAEIPDDLPWAYWSAAPADQRIPFAAGDEWIVLEGMSPHHPRLQSCLPGARAEARLYGLLPDPSLGHPIALVADTLSIDADARRCSVVWRGSFQVPDLRRLHALRVLAGVGTGQPVAFPERYAPAEPDDDDATTELAPRLLGALSRISPPQAAVEQAAPPAAHTTDLAPDLVAHLARAPSTPFVEAPAAPIEEGWAPGTAMLSDDVMAALAAAPATPFVSALPAPSPSTPFVEAPAAPIEEGWAPGTAMLSDSVMAALAAAPATPFVSAPAAPAPSTPFVEAPAVPIEEGWASGTAALSGDVMAALAAAAPTPFASAPPARSDVASPPPEDVPVDPPAPAARAEPPSPAAAPTEPEADPATPVEGDEPSPRTLGEAFLAGMEWAHGTRR